MVTFRPEVTDYDPAHLGDLAGGVGWTLDSSRAAVLVHDMQPYYLQVLPVGVQTKVDDAAAAITDWAVRHNVRVLLSGPRPADHPAKRGLGGLLWGQGPNADEATQLALPSLAQRSVYEDPEAFL